MPVVRNAVVPVHARYDQAVEIHWRLENGQFFIERRNLPPKPVVQARSFAPDNGTSAQPCGCDEGANNKCEQHR